MHSIDRLALPNANPANPVDNVNIGRLVSDRDTSWTLLTSSAPTAFGRRTMNRTKVNTEIVYLQWPEQTIWENAKTTVAEQRFRRTCPLTLRRGCGRLGELELMLPTCSAKQPWEGFLGG